MKIHKDIQQGSLDWLAMRLYIPTASCFTKIVTPKTGKISASARKYAFLLVAQKLLNRSLESLDGLEWIEHGKEHEDRARAAYEFENDITTERVGFITTDDGKIGCSPDSLVGTDGMLEIKCPAPQTIVGYAIDGMDEAYILQKQGQLYVAEREWCDLYAYSPEMPAIQTRFQRDEVVISNLAKALREFNEMKEEMYERMTASGYFAECDRVQSIAAETYGDTAMRDALDEALEPLPQTGNGTLSLADWLDDIANAPTAEGVEHKFKQACEALDGDIGGIAQLNHARATRITALALPAGQETPSFFKKDAK